MTEHTHARSESTLLAEIQVLLAEKRTYFSILRTGIAIISIALTIIVFLLASAQYHSLFNEYWVALIVVGSLCLVGFIGLFMVFHAQYKIHKIMRLMQNIEHKNKHVDEIVV